MRNTSEMRNRESAITYRTTAERHAKLKIAATRRGLKMQELLDEFLDAGLGNTPEQPRLSKEQRDGYSGLDALYKLAAHEPKTWSLCRNIVADILRAARKE